MIRFSCPKCERRVGVKDHLAERRGRCPGCGKVIVGPAKSPRLNEDRGMNNDESSPGLLRRYASKAWTSVIVGVVLIAAYWFVLPGGESVGAKMNGATDRGVPKNTEHSTANADSVGEVSTEATIGMPAWSSLGEAIQVGDVQIRLTKVVIGHVPLWNDIVRGETESKEELLTVWLEITNQGGQKPIKYNGWMSDFAPILDIDAKLSDDLDNEYQMGRFGRTLRIKDAETNVPIHPGKSIKDALVFQVPSEDADLLRLELSANALGEEGTVELRIPVEMVSQ